MKRKIVFIDDEDEVGMQRYFGAVERLDFEVAHCRCPNDYEPVIDGIAHSDAAMFVVDMRIAGSKRWSDTQTHHNEYTGICIAAALRGRFPGAPIVLWTSMMDVDIASVGKDHVRNKPQIVFVEKKIARDFEKLVAGYFENGFFGKEWGRIFAAALKKCGMSFPIFDIEL